MKVKAYNAAEESDEAVTESGRIPNPPANYSDLEDQVEEIQDRYKRRVIELDKDIKDQLQEELYLCVDDWSSSRSGLEQKLRDWNDLFEGVVPLTDFPWVGASNIHVPLPKVKAREITSTINRSTMRPIPFLATKYCGPDSLYEQNKDLTKEIEGFLEDKIKNDTNIHETLKEGLSPTFRDGTVPVQIMWDTSYEMVTDWKLYDKSEDFVTDYPSAEDAGISSSRYKEIMNLLINGKKYEAQFEYNAPIYDGPKAFLVPLIDFFYWPVFVPTLKDTKIHGKRVYYTDYQIKEKIRMEVFKQEDIDEIVKLDSGENRKESLTASRDQIEGISRGNKAIAREFEFFELVYKGALTKADIANDVVRKYLVWFHYLSKKVVRVESYPIRKGKISYFPMRFIKRDGRFLGISLCDDISDLSAEIDTIHRQRTNSRTITHVPSFKAKMTAKTTFDPSRREFRFRPGVTFYLSDVNDVVQFDIRPVDLSGSVDDEQMLYQLIDMVTGATGLSGQQNPLDPRAPARKQQEMLRQSSNRIDDYVQNLLPVFEDIGQFMLDLYYQYAPDRIKYYTTDADGDTIEQEIERTKLFNPNIKFKVNGTSVFSSPEMEYQRMQEIYQVLGTDPTTSGVPRIRRAALERLLMAGRVENEKNFLPNQQELPQAFTTDEQADRDAKAAMAKEKTASRLGDAAAKRQHDIAMAQHAADLEARNTIIEAAVAPQPSPDGAPNGAGAPAPAGLPAFPISPVAPAGGGVPPQLGI